MPETKRIRLEIPGAEFDAAGEPHSLTVTANATEIRPGVFEVDASTIVVDTTGNGLTAPSFPPRFTVEDA